MAIFLYIFNFTNRFLTLLLSWDYKTDLCKLSLQLKLAKNEDPFYYLFSFDPQDLQVSFCY